MGVSWIGALFIIPVLLSHLEKGGMLLHTKLNNSQVYFRDIPIDYHDLSNKCLSLQAMYCCKETMSIVLKSCLGTCACKED